MSEVFKTLYEIDVSERTDKKQNLTYLSWAWAWAEVKKKFPGATYEIKKFDNNLPYVFDKKTGYMVFTEVTIDDTTHEMWLPVMNHQNNAMKDETYQMKYGKRTVTIEPATMFDINKTIMRCLTKNLAMFGLGLYIFAGEDLPEEPEIVVELINTADVKTINKKIDHLAELTDGDTDENKVKLVSWVLGQAKVDEFNKIPKDFLDGLLRLIDRMIAKNEPKADEPDEEQESLFEGNTTTAKGSD